MPSDPRVLITTPVTQLLGINHPILLAPMDLVADGRLVAAVDAAEGFGILGGGYGEEKWLVRELDLLDRSKARFGVGFITWSLAKQPRLLVIALERTPAAVMLSFGSAGPFIDRIKRTAAIVICQVQSAALAKEAAAAGADILVAQGTEAGGHGVTRGSCYTRTGDCGCAWRAQTGRGCRGNRRRPRASCGTYAWRRGCVDGYTLLRLARGDRRARRQGTHSRSDWRRHAAQHRFRYLSAQCLTSSVYWAVPA
jgi:Nitronate monooxygenase